MPLSIWASNREHMVLAILAAIPTILWTYVVITASCVAVFTLMVAGTEGDFFHLLWGYSTATGPWSFLASKDRQSGETTSTTTLVFIQLGTIAMMIQAYGSPDQTNPVDLMAWFLPFMALGLITQFVGSLFAIRQSRTRGY